MRRRIDWRALSRLRKKMRRDSQIETHDGFPGENAPYIWVKTPPALGSWDFFDRLLGQAHVVTTPGAGFGPSGEGYVRLTAFGRRNETEEAVDRIKTRLAL